MKKITLSQGRGEYPSLHLMVTGNWRFQEGRLCFADPEEALKKVREWLEKNWIQNSPPGPESAGR